MLKKRKFLIKEDDTDSGVEDILNQGGDPDASPSEGSESGEKSTNSEEEKIDDEELNQDKGTDGGTAAGESEEEEKLLIPDEVKKTLEKLGFKENGQNSGEYTNDKFTDDLSVGISFNDNENQTTGESVSKFNNIYKNIILEEVDEVTCTIAYRTEDMSDNENEVINDFKFPKGIDSTELKKLILNAINDSIENDPKNKIDGVDIKKIEEAFKKLDEDEIKSFIVFYGDFNKEGKVWKFLDRIYKKIKQEGNN